MIHTLIKTLKKTLRKISSCEHKNEDLKALNKLLYSDYNEKNNSFKPWRKPHSP